MSEDIFDPYIILEELGSGSGGIVYKAYHKRLQKEVVLKEMKPHGKMETKRQEVDILKNLNHSYLPQVLDFFEKEGRVYTVMNYIPGKSFQQLYDEGVRFSTNEFIRWGMQLCSALAYLHSQKPMIIHGDIKPANIMLRPTGDICLIDFNIAFFFDDKELLGYSSGYSSPEQYIVVSDRNTPGRIPDYSCIDGKSDIYSLGMTLYFMATQRKVLDYKKGIDKEYLASMTNNAFAEVIGKATEIVPKKRFSNAYQMFLAFQNIPKMDRRYRNLLKIQRGKLIGMGLGMALSIISTGYGIHMMHIEKIESYNAIIKKQQSMIESGDFYEEEALFEKAKTLIPSEIETYYHQANAYYQQREYQECVEFINYDILENQRLNKESSRIADIYYLQGNAYYQQKDYVNAVKAYEAVLESGGIQAKYYRDYAIALSYNGELEKAEKILDEAKNFGLEEDGLYYAQGEIEKYLGNYEKALEEFRNCIESSSDDYLKMRSYVMMSEIYEAQGKTDENRNILWEARQKFSSVEQAVVLERLAQTDIELGNRTENSGYYAEAIETLEELVRQGRDTYKTHDTLAVLYQKIGEIEEAEKILQEMLSLYGEDYNIWKRFAFQEVLKQESKENSLRKYETFLDHYQKAKEMYNQRPQEDKTDMEMGLLDKMYDQISAGGWIG